MRIRYCTFLLISFSLIFYFQVNISPQVDYSAKKNDVSRLFKDLAINIDNGVSQLLHHNGRGQIVIDIGLLDGGETILAAQNGFTVFSFEPIRGFVDKIQNRLQSSNISYTYINNPDQKCPEKMANEKHVYLFHTALGNQSANLEIEIAEGGSSLVDKVNTGKTEKVHVRMLDNFIDCFPKQDIFLLKIDTQGFDLFALQGASRLLAAFHVQYLAVELYPRGLKAAGVDVQMLIDFIIDKGFLCFDVKNEESNGIPAHHPETRKDYSLFVESLALKAAGRFGIWDDLLCVNLKAR